jgi:DNA-binding transcriptional LysR family regulator
MQRTRQDELVSTLSCSLLRTFVRVVELGGVTRAAESLHLAQSAVSAQMATLSQCVGGPLLERRNGRSVPTELGRELYATAIEILARVATLETRLRAVTSERRLVVKLACTKTVCDRMLARAVALFGRRHPEATVVVESCDVRQALVHLRDNRCDMIFIEGDLEEPGVEVVPFHVDRLRLAMPAGDALAALGDPLDFAAFADRPFVMQPRDSGTRRFVEERLDRRFRLLSIPLELESNDAIVSCVEEGLGLAFLSDTMLARPLRLGTLVARNVRGVDLSRQFATALRSGDAGTEGARLFLAFLQNDYDSDRREPSMAAAPMK